MFPDRRRSTWRTRSWVAPRSSRTWASSWSAQWWHPRQLWPAWHYGSARTTPMKWSRSDRTGCRFGSGSSPSSVRIGSRRPIDCNFLRNKQHLCPWGIIILARGIERGVVVGKVLEDWSCDSPIASLWNTWKAAIINPSIPKNGNLHSYLNRAPCFITFVSMSDKQSLLHSLEKCMQEILNLVVTRQWPDHDMTGTMKRP